MEGHSPLETPACRVATPRRGVLRRCFGCESQARDRDARSAIVRAPGQHVARTAHSSELSAALPTGPVGIPPTMLGERPFLPVTCSRESEEQASREGTRPERQLLDKGSACVGCARGNVCCGNDAGADRPLMPRLCLGVRLGRSGNRVRKSSPRVRSAQRRAISRSAWRRRADCGDSGAWPNAVTSSSGWEHRCPYPVAGVRWA